MIKIRRYMVECNRQSGRSTRNILKAVLFALEGNNCAIVVANPHQISYNVDFVANILHTLNVNVIKCNHNNMKIEIYQGSFNIRFDVLHKSSPSAAPWVFTDHYALEKYNGN